MTDRDLAGPRWRRSGGYTLLEVCLAILLLSLALVPLISVLRSETRQVRFNEEKAIASLLVGQILDRFRDDPLDRLEALCKEDRGKPISSDPMLTPTTDPQTQAYRRLLEKFERSMALERSGDAIGVLTARVRWTTARGTRDEMTRSIVVGRNPVPGARE